MPESLLLLLAAALGGAAVGVERQWSGHATGPQARFAGIRTFTLLGTLGGLAGRFWVWEAPLLAVTVLALAGLLVVAAYAAASRHDVDATTEAAALIVLGAGTAAGLGQTGVASGIVAVTTLLLFEKSRLHDLVARLQGPELSAAFRFAVMAVVILPLLPEGPIGTVAGGVKPRELWLLVLFFSGLSFLGYIAQRAIGTTHGHVVAGLLGGIVSSTSVTLAYARRSREEPALARSLSRGVVAANTVLYVRVLVAAAILSPPLAVALAPALAAPLAVGLLAAATGVRLREANQTAIGAAARNPLQLRSALEMAAIFQVVITLAAILGARFGASGLLGMAAVLGLTDADALTLSMARGVSAGSVAAPLAATAVALGLLSNTLVKTAMTLLAGRGAFRTATAAVLLLMAAALLAAVVAMSWPPG